ncbi:hypothetical protein [Streptomyces prunicolor]|uniref:hypothetical protein n=1 Tax=Streptomyces prunicolor TaxID=67348 RepID=UPI00037001BB|nr:hypothetical protein [Streptomyces prunicolor]
MRSFSVYVEFDETEASPDIYAALFDALLDKHGAVGPAPNGNLSVRLSVRTDSVVEAAALGIEYAEAAVARHGITADSVIGTEVITHGERDRRLVDDHLGAPPTDVRPDDEDEPAFSVYVEFDTADTSPETYEALFDALLDKHGAVGPAPNGNLSVRLSVRTDSVVEAAALGIEYAEAAVARHGITADSVIGTEVITQPGARICGGE